MNECMPRSNSSLSRKRVLDSYQAMTRLISVACGGRVKEEGVAGKGRGRKGRKEETKKSSRNKKKRKKNKNTNKIYTTHHHTPTTPTTTTTTSGSH